jgi:hypothetical protein
MEQLATNLGSGGSPFYSILTFDAIYSLLLVIDLLLDFGLVQSVDNRVLPCLYVD